MRCESGVTMSMMRDFNCLFKRTANLAVDATLMNDMTQVSRCLQEERTAALQVLMRYLRDGWELTSFPSRTVRAYTGPAWSSSIFSQPHVCVSHTRMVLFRKQQRQQRQSRSREQQDVDKKKTLGQVEVSSIWPRKRYPKRANWAAESVYKAQSTNLDICPLQTKVGKATGILRETPASLIPSRPQVAYEHVRPSQV